MMGTTLRMMLAMIALIVLSTAAPQSVGAQTQSPVAASSGDGPVVLAGLPSDLTSAQNMPVAQAGAIIGGGLAGFVLADMLLDGGMFTVVGVLAGAVLGNSWYSQHYWPF